MPLDPSAKNATAFQDYGGLLASMVSLIEEARRCSARTVNAIMTATYWEIGRRVVQSEQAGLRRAGYGDALLKRLSDDMTSRFGRGFSPDNIENMRRFYLAFDTVEISETPSRKLGQKKTETPSRKSKAASPLPSLSDLSRRFPLPWSAYVRLLSVKDEAGRRFYEEEALRSGWSVRQLDRQIQSLFYERTTLSKNKAALLTKGARALPQDAVQPEEEIKDPFVLEFLGLKDEAVAKYALEGLPNKVLAAEYKMILPEEKVIVRELEATRKMLEERRKK